MTAKCAWSILAGTGKGFCAGHDLKEIKALKELPKIEALFGQCSRMMQTIPLLPQPVIAKVQGVAAAAGCQLVAQCDLAIAVEGAKFVTSGVTWGFFCSTPGVAVGRNLQRKHAMEMLLTGEPISAAAGDGVGPGQSGRSCGPAGCGSAEARRQPWPPSRRPPSPPGKRAFYQQMDLGLEQAYALASGVISASFAHEEGRAGMDAFIEEAAAQALTQEVEQQAVDRFRLLLLHPVPGARHQMAATHLRERFALHALELTGLLIDAPVCRAGDEHRGHVDGAPGKLHQLRDEVGSGRAPIPLQSALEPRLR